MIKESSVWVYLTAGNPPERQPFHKLLLCERSPYFSALFDGEFVEAGSQTHHVDNYDFEVIKNFFAWLHTRDLPPFETDKDSPNAKILKDLFKLYTFAEYVQVKYVGDHIISHIMRHLPENTVVSLEAINENFDAVSAHSSLEQFMIDCVIEHHLPCPSSEAVSTLVQKEPLSAKLAQAVMTQLLMTKQVDDDSVKFEFKLKKPRRQHTRDLTSCRYHGHAKGSAKNHCPWFKPR